MSGVFHRTPLPPPLITPPLTVILRKQTKHTHRDTRRRGQTLTELRHTALSQPLFSFLCHAKLPCSLSGPPTHGRDPHTTPPCTHTHTHSHPDPLLMSGHEVRHVPPARGVDQSQPTGHCQSCRSTCFFLASDYFQTRSGLPMPNRATVTVTHAGNECVASGCSTASRTRAGLEFCYYLAAEAH